MFKAYDAKSTGMISDLVKKLNQIEPRLDRGNGCVYLKTIVV